jgi:hypothetical protein
MIKHDIAVVYIYTVFSYQNEIKYNKALIPPQTPRFDLLWSTLAQGHAFVASNI